MPNSCSVAVIAALALAAEASWSIEELLESPKENTDAKELLHDLLAALPADAGATSGRSSLEELEGDLRPMAAALPKTSRGTLGAVAVRYVLHRLFLKKHGWLIKGLDPEGQAWNSTSPTTALLEVVPAEVKAPLTRGLASSGLTLQETAVLAAVLRHAIHKEAARRLRAIYRLLGMDTSRRVPVAWAKRAVEAYTSGLILGRDPTSLKPAELHDDLKTMSEAFPQWPNVLDSMRKELRWKVQFGTVDFSAATKAAQNVSENFAHWQEPACQAIKGSLLKLEDKGNGRVRLADFYGQALHEGEWQLSENEAYLRQLGALDETNPSNIRVIIPNYVQGASNCLGASAYLSLCCLPECEAIREQLEQRLGAAEAAPGIVAQHVAALPSASIRANRSLSSVMMHRLNSIAAAHGAHVPIHGRLFAQWLHHAYPRECPFPHLSGTTRPLQVLDWSKSTGLDVFASTAAMAAHAGPHKAAKKSGRRWEPVETAPWSYQEEIFVHAGDRPSGWLVVQGAVHVAALAVTTFGLVLLRQLRVGRAACQVAVTKLCPV